MSVFVFLHMHVCTVYVFLSVCLSARTHVSGTTSQNFTKFSILMTVDQFFSGCVAIYYVLPVLMMTSYLEILARYRRREKGVYSK